MKKKIAIYARTFHSPYLRGFSRYTLNLIDSLLDSNQFEIYLVSDITIDQRFKNYFQDRVTFMERKKFPTLVWRHLIMPLLLFFKNISLFHIPSNTGVPFFKMPGVKYSLTIHDLISYENAHRADLNKTFGLLLYQWEWKLSLHSDHVITVSNYVAQNLKNYNVKATVIYNSVNQEFIQPQEQLLSDRDYFLYLGGFDERKNIPFLLQTFSEFTNNTGNTVPLKIVGKISEKEKESYAPYINCPQIIFLGYVEDEHLPFLYKNAVATILPSFKEGFGLQVIESMASLTPIISSNKTSLPEIAQQCALYFDPNSHNELITCIETVLHNSEQYKQLVAACKNRRIQFTREVLAQQYIDYFSSILEE